MVEHTAGRLLTWVYAQCDINQTWCNPQSYNLSRPEAEAGDYHELNVVLSCVVEEAVWLLEILSQETKQQQQHGYREEK